MSQLLSGRSYLVPIDFDPTSLADIDVGDRIEIDAIALPVKELRATLASAQQRPYGERRLLMIKNAESLTEIHQNTLLKLLEEPPLFLIIVLLAGSAEQFLPTVRSRLHTVTDKTSVKIVSSALPDQPSAALIFLQKAKDRAALVLMLKSELAFQLQHLDQNSATRLSLLERAIVRLQHNTNQKLVIDWLLLHWFAENGKG